MILKLLPEILLNGRKGLIKQASILIGGVEGGVQDGKGRKGDVSELVDFQNKIMINRVE